MPVLVPFSAKVIQIHFLIGVDLLFAVSNQQFLFPNKKLEKTFEVFWVNFTVS